MRALRIVLPVLVLVLLAHHFVWMGDGKWHAGPDDAFPDIPVREGNRACCAFGVDIPAKYLEIPVPLLNMTRVANADDLGPHRYDASFGALDDERGNAFPLGERNALVYTCRGGFVDTAHLREPADWVAYLFTQFDRHLESGVTLDLPDEGTTRRIVLRPLPAEVIARNGRDELLLAMAQWVAYQLAIWHEIVQWCGVSMLESFPETPSGFSPEDSYTNAVGLRALDGQDLRGALVSEKAYNRFMDGLIVETLEALGAVPRELGYEAVHAVDQLWWDSAQRIPDNRLVRRRYLDADSELLPWLLPAEHTPPQLRARLAELCGPDPQPLRFEIREELPGIRFRDALTLEFGMTERLEGMPVFSAVGSSFDQEALPGLVAAVREEVLETFGPRADRPD